MSLGLPIDLIGVALAPASFPRQAAMSRAQAGQLFLDGAPLSPAHCSQQP